MELSKLIFKALTCCWCRYLGGEPANWPRAAAADTKGERTGAPSTAGVPEPAGPHTNLLPH